MLSVSVVLSALLRGLEGYFGGLDGVYRTPSPDGCHGRGTTGASPHCLCDAVCAGGLRPSARICIAGARPLGRRFRPICLVDDDSAPRAHTHPLGAI